MLKQSADQEPDEWCVVILVDVAENGEIVTGSSTGAIAEVAVV